MQVSYAGLATSRTTHNTCGWPEWARAYQVALATVSQKTIVALQSEARPASQSPRGGGSWHRQTVIVGRGGDTVTGGEAIKPRVR